MVKLTNNHGKLDIDVVAIDDIPDVDEMSLEAFASLHLNDVYEPLLSEKDQNKVWFLLKFLVANRHDIFDPSHSEILAMFSEEDQQVLLTYWDIISQLRITNPRDKFNYN